MAPQVQAGPLATETVQEYALLWLRLRELYLAALAPWEAAMVHWLLYTWAFTLLCLFVSLGALLSGQVRRVVSMMGIVLNDLSIVILVCYFAEKAEQDVSEKERKSPIEGTGFSRRLRLSQCDVLSEFVPKVAFTLPPQMRRGLRLELLRYPVHRLSPRCADEVRGLLVQWAGAGVLPVPVATDPGRVHPVPVATVLPPTRP